MLYGFLIYFMEGYNAMDSSRCFIAMKLRVWLWGVKFQYLYDKYERDVSWMLDLYIQFFQGDQIYIITQLLCDFRGVAAQAPSCLIF
jgi:hypothetical protein